MSIKIMSRVWDADLPPLEKLILLAMADWARDPDGYCYPSIVTISKKCGVSERTVQRTIRWAEGEGMLTRIENKGKGCEYYIKGRHTVTPDTQSPVTTTTPTPDTQSPNTLVTVKSSRAKALSVRAMPISDLTDGFRTDCIAWSLEKMGWGSVMADQEFERFSDNAKANDRRYKDWDAAWRNWCRSPYCKTKSAEDRVAYRKEPLRV